MIKVLGTITRLFPKLIFFLFLTPASLLADEIPEDRNSDGNADRWTQDAGDGKQTIKSDNNYDGTVDYLIEIDKKGNKIYEEFDFNFDGEMDDFYFYTKGVLQRQEIDSNFDGNIDVWTYLDKGVYILKIERDTDYDGKIDFTKEY